MTQQNLVNPIMQQWSFTLEQQLSNDWAVRASYIGAQTHHMFWYAGDINKPNIQQPNVPLQAQRPYQPWSQINATQSGGSVNFNQLQLEVNKRFASGFFFKGITLIPAVWITCRWWGARKTRITPARNTETPIQSRARYSA